jgi:hypothetical protein
MFPLNIQLFPAAPVDGVGAVHPGLLYWDPKIVDTIAPPNVPPVYEYFNQVPQPVGRVIEPLKPQGSRMQMRYIEDDFGLSYRQPSEFGIDVEQLYWAPFNDEVVQFDVFDRFTMELGHSDRRTDEHWRIQQTVTPGTPPVGSDPVCELVCVSMNSALSTTFNDNWLPGAPRETVFRDKVYSINPSQAFRNIEQVKFVPFPRFDRSYTWRDSRLVSIDGSGNIVGLGGAQNPGTGANPTVTNDWTANIDSPWVRDASDTTQPEFDSYTAFTVAGGTTWVVDSADFVGNVQRDHDPIALPLLVDFRVYADDAANGLARGTNGFQMGMLGGPTRGFPPGLAPLSGYYDILPAGCDPVLPAWPRVRVQRSGGVDLTSGLTFDIDVANALTAAPSPVRDAGVGNAAALFQAPAGDGMLNWAHADFVRRVSTMTLGFFDTLQPQRSAVTLPAEGFPNLLAVGANLRIADLLVQLDPPQARQAVGTTVIAEVRGVEEIAPGVAAGTSLYAPDPTNRATDSFNQRGQLLNPNYACEAFRYSQQNISGAPRVDAVGLTRYVTDDQLGLIRRPDGRLPRYMNVRITMTNNLNTTPAVSPSLRSLQLAYRVVPN